MVHQLAKGVHCPAMRSFLESLMQDVRYAIRLARLKPGFTFVGIASFALGAGANTAMVQVLDALNFRPLPVVSPRQLVQVRVDDMTHARGTWLREAAITTPLWERIRAQQTALSRPFAWADESLDASSPGEVRTLAGLWVS